MRMIGAGQQITPFDREDDYAICGVMVRKSNDMQYFVEPQCPYYVEHYLNAIKNGK
jgi:hypothetical protein